MKRIILTLSAMTLVSIACGSSSDIVRGIIPVNDANVSSTSERRVKLDGGTCTITVHYGGPLFWKKIRQSESLTKRAGSMRTARDPRYELFIITARNKSDTPVRIDPPVIICNDKKYNPINLNDVKELALSPSYAIYDFPAITRPRRILTRRINMEKLLIDRDTVESTIDEISPGNAVLKFFSFPWIPIQYRDFIMMVTILSPGEKKVIAFRFERMEYRTYGKHFLNSSKRNEQ